MANGTGGENQIRIGVSEESLVTVWSGTAGAPKLGGVAIGVSGSNSLFGAPLQGNLTGSRFTNNNLGTHSLVVTGVQTIGTNNPVSLMNPGASGASGLFGGNSMLKISRNLYSTTTSFGVKGISAAGTYPFNYTNGLEITSFIPTSPTTVKGSNRSVAISVASSATIRNSDGSSPTSPATGFYVSDTGENIAIGRYIDSTAAIGVSGAAGDHAIKALGDVGITGNFSVVGNISATGNTILNGNTNTTGGSLTIGNGGTPILKTIAGSVTCPIDGTPPTINYGSGFTATMVASGLNTARVRITFNVPFSNANLVATSNIFLGTAAPTLQYTGSAGNYGGPTTTHCEFIFRNIGLGTATLNFLIQQVA
jgi:hypothetical protein